MKQLFSALEAAHPGSKVKDVGFTVDPALPPESDVDVDAVDGDLAEAVRTAEPINPEDLIA